MGNPNKKFIHVTWSGGIDSTGVVAQLLWKGWMVQPITLLFGRAGYKEREAIARGYFTKYFQSMYPDRLLPPKTVNGNFLDQFSHDGVEITRRNKHILDYMMQRYVIPEDGYYIGMGEYIGADTWVVKDHVGAHDADSRYLAAYLLSEYGLGYRFMALNDFGESRYKADRVRLLVDAVGGQNALQTTNCMSNHYRKHCGQCYKCIERHVAFTEILGEGFDTTEYLVDPATTAAFPLYIRQQAGELVDLSWKDVRT